MILDLAALRERAMGMEFSARWSILELIQKYEAVCAERDVLYKFQTEERPRLLAENTRWSQVCGAQDKRIDQLEARLAEATAERPKEKTGVWEESFSGDFCWCSECRETEHKKSPYCPNCGAKMRRTDHG